MLVVLGVCILLVWGVWRTDCCLKSAPTLVDRVALPQPVTSRQWLTKNLDMEALLERVPQTAGVEETTGDVECAAMVGGGVGAGGVCCLCQQ